MTRYFASAPAPAVDAEVLLGVPWSRPGRCFFAARDGVTVAGLGEAAVVEASGAERFAALEAGRRQVLGGLESLDGSAAPLLVGGFAFADTVEARGPWGGWAPARLVLPDVSYVDDGEARLVAVAPEGMSRDEAAAWSSETLSRLGEALLVTASLPPETPTDTATGAWGFVERGEAPTPMAASAGGLGLVGTVAPPASSTDPYEELVADGLRAIAAGHLRKVTLARRRRFGRVRGTEARDVLRAFARRYPRCFRFWIEPPGRPAFAGASPERLVARRGDRVLADALAGTVGRSPEPAADANLGALLLANNKERREHGAVVDFLRERLGGFAELDAPPVPELLKLANVQHLHTPFVGALRDATSILDLAAAVHPTPAVAGAPVDVARDWIARHEELDRGWYSGGVGVAGLDGQGEFSVAIRSGLFEDDALLLFAGAGIVAGSDPTREAREVEQKMRALRDLLVEG